MSGSLGGQVALVTGCARRRGIGRGIALGLAEAGADVVVADLEVAGTRNESEPAGGDDEGWRGVESLSEEIEALGRRAFYLTGNVADETDAARMVADSVTSLGRLDILVNNAAAPHGQDRNWFWETPAAAFDFVMSVNTRGAFLMSRAFTLQALERQGRGRIVNIASIAGIKGQPKRAAYSASKFAVIGLTQVMAIELAPHGITVNAVCPGVIGTDRNRSTRERLEQGDATATAALGGAVGRIGVPEDVARTVVFLAAPEADYITGQAISVDGGQYLG
jgi:3-oxoacyl-[acyl-carrier protein] reductase